LFHIVNVECRQPVFVLGCVVQKCSKWNKCHLSNLSKICSISSVAITALIVSGRTLNYRVLSASTQSQMMVPIQIKPRA
jgi:hypothetical protein